MPIKLGKKVNPKITKNEIIKMLVDGAVLHTSCGLEISFIGNQVVYTGCFSNPNSDPITNFDWYYEAEKTYTINSIKLIDKRLRYEEAVKSQCIYFSSTMSISLYEICNQPNMQNKEYMQQLCDFSLVHSTQEAAVLHTAAMLRVPV